MARPCDLGEGLAKPSAGGFKVRSILFSHKYSMTLSVTEENKCFKPLPSLIFKKVILHRTAYWAEDHGADGARLPGRRPGFRSSFLSKNTWLVV